MAGKTKIYNYSHKKCYRWLFVGLAAAELYGYRQAVRHMALTHVSVVRFNLSLFGFNSILNPFNLCLIAKCWLNARHKGGEVLTAYKCGFGRIPLSVVNLLYVRKDVKIRSLITYKAGRN